MSQMRVFSTAGLPAARRIELWEGHNTAALTGLSCHTAVPLGWRSMGLPEDPERSLREAMSSLLGLLGLLGRGA